MIGNHNPNPEHILITLLGIQCSDRIRNQTTNPEYIMLTLPGIQCSERM